MMTKLPQSILDKIDYLYKNVNARFALETLLVASGVKSGDYYTTGFLYGDSEIHSLEIERYNIERFLVYKQALKTINEIKELSSSLFCTNLDTGIILIYNNDISNELLSQVIKSFNNELSQNETDRVTGLFYGYPSCCVNDYADGIINGLNSGIVECTEHMWCKEDCKESKIIRKDYIKVVKKNIRNLLPELKNFKKLKMPNLINL